MEEQRDYILLKLVSGEFIMGRFELGSTQEDDWCLEHAMVVNYALEPVTGQSQIFLTDVNPFYSKDGYVAFAKKHVIFTSPLDDEFISYYESNVKKKLRKISDIATEKSLEAVNDDLPQGIRILMGLQRDANTVIN